MSKVSRILELPRLRDEGGLQCDISNRGVQISEVFRDFRGRSVDSLVMIEDEDAQGRELEVFGYEELFTDLEERVVEEVRSMCGVQSIIGERLREVVESVEVVGEGGRENLQWRVCEDGVAIMGEGMEYRKVFDLCSIAEDDLSEVFDYVQRFAGDVFDRTYLRVVGLAGALSVYAMNSEGVRELQGRVEECAREFLVGSVDGALLRWLMDGLQMQCQWSSEDDTYQCVKKLGDGRELVVRAKF